jgi:hypothetical protein
MGAWFKNLEGTGVSNSLQNGFRLRIFFLSLLSTEITDVCYHAWMLPTFLKGLL